MDVLTAQRNCALQVCRHLNELNLLSLDVQRGANKNIADNDFYEEDEDTFYVGLLFDFELFSVISLSISKMKTKAK